MTTPAIWIFLGGVWGPFRGWSPAARTAHSRNWGRNFPPTEDGKDEHAPVDLALTVEVLELRRHHHVHVHKCRHVAVEVNFNGKTKRRRFSPATTIGVVTQWARKKFHLDPAAAAEYVLQLCNSTKQPRSAEHLGELVEPPKCSICFDLVKEITPQG